LTTWRSNGFFAIPAINFAEVGWTRPAPYETCPCGAVWIDTLLGDVTNPNTSDITRAHIWYCHSSVSLVSMRKIWMHGIQLGWYIAFEKAY
jgi:hypothetical protein